MVPVSFCSGRNPRLDQGCRNVALVLTVVACHESLQDRFETESSRRRVPGDEGCSRSVSNLR